MRDKKIDFIIIGAPKAGTTALHQLIKDHPEIAIPPSKELPFFSDDRIYKRGLDWYLKQLPQSKGQLVGTITPQYFLGSMDVDVVEIASRIRKDVGKDTKLILMLREPISRAFSHYKMVYRRGYEKRNFNEAILDSTLKYHNNELPFDYTTEAFFGSLYGQNIKPYLKNFERSNILVLFAEDLRRDPRNEVQKVLKFLGAKDSNWSPPKSVSSKEIHKGGLEPKYKFLTPKNLKRIPGLFALWNNLIPYSLKKRIDFGINSWNVKPDEVKMDKEIDARVIDFFNKQVAEFEKEMTLKTPWHSSR